MTNPLALARPVVDAPVAVPYRFGLFNVLTPTAPPDGDDDHWRAGVQWRSEACGGARETSGSCFTDAAVAPLVPDFHTCYVSGFDPFTVYSYNDDTTSSYALNQQEAVARARLGYGEQEAVELHLWKQMQTALASPVVGTAKSLTYCLGWIEQRLAELYGNQGTIHMNRLVASELAGPGGSLVREGQKLTTSLGTQVVAGGGYDETGGALPSTATIYATGPLVMYRGAVTTTPPQSLDRERNDMSIIAQRDYVIGWDCVLIGITVTL